MSFMFCNWLRLPRVGPGTPLPPCQSINQSLVAIVNLLLKEIMMMMMTATTLCHEWFAFVLHVQETPYFPAKEGFVFVNDVPEEERVRGDLPPVKKEDCEVFINC